MRCRSLVMQIASGLCGFRILVQLRGREQNNNQHAVYITEHIPLASEAESSTSDDDAVDSPVL